MEEGFRSDQDPHVPGFTHVESTTEYGSVIRYSADLQDEPETEIGVVSSAVTDNSAIPTEEVS